jgi:CRISPR-associated protein Csm5
MKLKIRTLSPLFIGSGEDYNGISYIVDGNRIKFYDLHGIMGDMSQQQEKEFISFIERHGSRSSLKRLLREVFGAETCPELDSHCIYKLPAAGKVDDGRTIRAFIAEGKNAYIPGTEIKGAIRTAVLYYLLNPDLRHKRNTANLFAKRLYDSLATLIEKRIQGSDDVPRLRDIERELEGVVFRARGNMEDARYDVFKGLLIRDSEPKPAEGCLFTGGRRDAADALLSLPSSAVKVRPSYARRCR